MRILWKLTKVVIAAAILIPLGLMMLGLMFGVLGAIVGLAVMVLRLGVLGLGAYVLYRIARFFLGRGSQPITVPPVRSIASAEQPTRDPYYEAAMRELDAEIDRR